MNLWTGRNVILPDNINSASELSEKQKKSLDQINHSLELYDFCHFFDKVDVTPKEGDIFVVQVVKNKYLYGKVISTNVQLYDDSNKIQSELVVVIYRYSSDKIHVPDFSLRLDDLLIKPLLQTKFFFNSGFAKIIANQDLTEEEKEIDLGFGIGNRYFDVYGNDLNGEPKYKGVLIVEGLGIAFDIARILTIDETVLGQEYIVPVRKKLPLVRNVKGQMNYEIIDDIIEKIIFIQKELGSYNKDVKKAIPVLSKALYSFKNKSEQQNSVELYLNAVDELVERINQINDYTNHCLIETEEREEIYSFIDNVSTSLGYSFDYDITEKIRKW